MERNCLNCTNIRKVSIIGCGFVGAACAFSIMQSGLFSEIVLIDSDKNKAEGEAFDPNFHNAVMTREEPGCESGIVLSDMQKGYILNGRVIRPTMVIVSQ